MSDVSPLWPPIVDDDGSGKAGTPVNNPNVWDKIKLAINDQVLSANNPTVKPSDIIDEIVAAREGDPDLDTRIGNILNSLATLYAPKNASETGIPIRNLIPNGDFLLWPDGDSLAPSYWKDTPAAPTAVTRTANPGNSSFVAGSFYNKISAASTLTKREHTILDTTEFPAHAVNLQSKNLGFACHVIAADDRTIALEVYDGVNTTRLTAVGGQDSWLNGVHPINAAATQLVIRILVLQPPANDNYVGAVIACVSGVAPATFYPCQMQDGTIHLAAVAVVGSDVARFLPGQPGIITGVLLHGSVGSGTLQVDVKSWRQSAGVSQSIFAAGGPSLTVANVYAFLAPDSDYFRRCFGPVEIGGRGDVNGSIISLDVLSAGAGGVAIACEVRTRQYIRPLEGYKTVTA